MSYRDTAESLRAYRDRIAAELAEAKRSAVKVDALEKELAETEALLRKVAGPRALPVLENVRIAAPCHASWDEMAGDDRVRFCGHCEKNVYNLSAMPREEAEALLAEKEGQMCVRLYRRADGTVLTADCPVGVKRRRRRRAVVAAAFGSGLLAAGLASAGSVTQGEIAPIQGAVAPPVETVMGSIAEPPPAPPTPTTRSQSQTDTPPPRPARPTRPGAHPLMGKPTMGHFVPMPNDPRTSPKR